MATVYRFGDTVALHLRTGPTRYMSARDARAMAGAINRVARSIKAERFHESTAGTWSGPDMERADLVDIGKIKRKESADA